MERSDRKSRHTDDEPHCQSLIAFWKTWTKRMREEVCCYHYRDYTSPKDGHERAGPLLVSDIVDERCINRVEWVRERVSR